LKIGFRPVHGVSASQAMAPAPGLRPVMQSGPQTDRTIQFQQQRPSPLVQGNSQANQLGEDGQDLMQPSRPEANEAEKKVLFFSFLDLSACKLWNKNKQCMLWSHFTACSFANRNPFLGMNNFI